MKNLNKNIEISVEEKESLFSPDIKEYNDRINDRILYINEDITEFTIDYSMLILKWNKEDVGLENPKPIRIFIHSNGGDLSAIFNLIDVISISKTPVYTIGLGNCYSSGGLLLMSGHKRFIFEHTTFLLHDGYCGSMGSTGKMLDNLQFTKEQEEKLKRYVLKNTSIDEETYDKNYRKDWFMFSEDILKYKIADKIIDSLEEVF